MFSFDSEGAVKAAAANTVAAKAAGAGGAMKDKQRRGLAPAFFRKPVVNVARGLAPAFPCIPR